MHNLPPPPPGDIADMLALQLQEDNSLQVMVADHHRTDVRVQSYITTLSQSWHLHLDFQPLEKIRAHLAAGATQTTGDSAGQNFSENQQRVVNYFRQAARLGASDIHLQIGKNGLTCVEMRIHGDLCVMDSIPQEAGYALASTIVLSMCDVAEPQFNAFHAQDARVRQEYLQGLRLFGARYAHTPSVSGLYVVMRILTDEGDDPPDLNALGFLPRQQALLCQMTGITEGMVVFSGPTGSGKSTTLRTLARNYLTDTGGRRRLLTHEDPPEGLIEGAVQTAIEADRSDPQAVVQAWLRALSIAMRLDPDAMIVGEMRDLASAMGCISAAMTGHLLMSSVHANDPIAILDRLVVLGVALGLLTDPQLFIGLISQRLVQVLCPHCRRPWSAVEGDLTDLQRQLVSENCRTDAVFFRHDPGCAHCHRGVVGRSVIAEVIRPNAPFMRIYQTQGKLAARAYWVNEMQGITRNAHLLHHINAGNVDPLAGHRVSPLDEDRWLQLEKVVL